MIKKNIAFIINLPSTDISYTETSAVITAYLIGRLLDFYVQFYLNNLTKKQRLVPLILSIGHLLGLWAVEGNRRIVINQFMGIRDGRFAADFDPIKLHGER
jgi:hypothetical protein